MTLTQEARDLASAALRRFANEQMSPVEIAEEIERWEHHRSLLAGDLEARDVAIGDAESLTNGIAYADIRLAELERQAKRVLRSRRVRAGGGGVDFSRAKYADLVGLAEAVTGHAAVKAGNGRYRMLCPFHDDSKPSLVIYPPGQGWWCPVCGRGGQDAASFCAEFFHCSQAEGLRWVEQLADGVSAA